MDGIYVFNVFNPLNPLWNELGDAEKLRGLSKSYFVNYRTVNHARSYLAGGEQYIGIPLLDSISPMVLDPGTSAATTLNCGDDGSTLPPTARVILRLEVAEAATGPAVSVNGHSLGAGTVSDGWVEYAVPSSALVRGGNAIAVSLGADAAGTVTISDLQLCVECEQ